MNNLVIHNVSRIAEDATVWPMTKVLLGDRFSVVSEAASEEGPEKLIYRLPMILRSQKFSSEIIETSLLESYLGQLFSQANQQSQNKSDFSQINSTLNTLEIKHSHSFLAQELGMFCLWAWKSEIYAMKINSEIAEILDDALEGNVAMVKQHQKFKGLLFSFLQECGILV